jgi:hypothetical protein
MIEVPLRLWNQPHWEVKGRPDSVHFFRILGSAFPGATTLFLEGTCIAGDVQAFYDSAAESGPQLPARQTIWPRPKLYRLPADHLTLKRLSELAASHAEPEILDHLFLFAGTDPVLEYPDAFARDCPIFISGEVPESQVRWFAQELGLDVERIDIS